MLVQTFNPFDNLVLSSLIAAVPIILFLLCLTVFKMKGIYAAITTLVVTLLLLSCSSNYHLALQQVVL